MEQVMMAAVEAKDTAFRLRGGGGGGEGATQTPSSAFHTGALGGSRLRRGGEVGEEEGQPYGGGSGGGFGSPTPEDHPPLPELFEGGGGGIAGAAAGRPFPLSPLQPRTSAALPSSPLNLTSASEVAKSMGDQQQQQQHGGDGHADYHNMEQDVVIEGKQKRPLWAHMLQAVAACASSLVQQVGAGCFEVRSSSGSVLFFDIMMYTHGYTLESL